MIATEVVIIGVGAISAVGLTVQECAASIRAGTARFTPSIWLGDTKWPYMLAQIPDDVLPPLREELGGFVLPSREERMLRSGGAALAACLEPIAGRNLRVGLHVAMPEIPPHFLHGEMKFLRLLAFQANADALVERVSVTAAGRSGGLVAMARAATELQNGTNRLIAVGGVDSYRDCQILQSLDAEGRLKRGRNLDGFIPGEGAAFVLLTTSGLAATYRLPVLARLQGVSEGFERGHLYSKEPYRGDGLADTLRRFVQDTATPPCGEVYSAMNGESFWAKEWGVAFIRNQGAFAPNHRIHHPADSFGDLGSAAAPMLVGLAVHGLTNGYRNGPCLISASSDRGERAIAGISS